MISEIRTGTYKTHNTQQEIPIKPLTVVNKGISGATPYINPPINISLFSSKFATKWAELNDMLQYLS